MMLARMLRGRGAAMLGASVTTMWAASGRSETRLEPRVYVSGEALGRGVRLELWKAKHENVVVLDLEHEVVQLGLTRVRDRECKGRKFVHDADGLVRAAVALALTELPSEDEAVVTTPTGYSAQGSVIEGESKVCAITVGSDFAVQRSIMQVVQDALPFNAEVGSVLVEQDEAKGEIKLGRSVLPPNLDGCQVLVFLPELSSIDTVHKVMHLLGQHGIEHDQITVVTLVTCPEAADKFCQTFSESRLVTAAFDATRDAHGHTVPGIGDFEARYVPTRGNKSEKSRSWFSIRGT